MCSVCKMQNFFNDSVIFPTDYLVVPNNLLTHTHTNRQSTLLFRYAHTREAHAWKHRQDGDFTGIPLLLSSCPLAKRTKLA